MSGGNGEVYGRAGVTSVSANVLKSTHSYIGEKARSERIVSWLYSVIEYMEYLRSRIGECGIRYGNR
jgi:hypothetical protein